MTRFVSAEKAGIGTILATDVDSAIVTAVRVLKEHGLELASRVGDTLEYPTPIVTIYSDPTKRVSFMEERDANPFFHLFEALWMIGGGDDLASLLLFNSKFGQYSDDGKLIRGSAYGVRWRHWFGHDQIKNAIERLRTNPQDRRVVLQMWDAFTDPVIESKDVPCNTAAYLRNRGDGVLDLTVTNRSNDMIFGALGSNVVHFSMLLDYIAAATDMEIGKYYQVSNSYHAYTSNPIFAKYSSGTKSAKTYEQYSAIPSKFKPGDIPNVDRDIVFLMREVRKCGEVTVQKDIDAAMIELLAALSAKVWESEFFREIAGPMFVSYFSWKVTGGIKLATHSLRGVRDWHIAGLNWLQRRMK